MAIEKLEDTRALTLEDEITNQYIKKPKTVGALEEWEKPYISQRTAAQVKAKLPQLMQPRVAGSKSLSSLAKLLNISNWLNITYLERQDEIQIALVCLLAEEHLCFIGKKGAAKTALLTELLECITGARVFSYLLSPDMSLQELLGQFSAEGYKLGKLFRETANKLSWANFAILDEIWKAKGHAVNGILELINRGRVQTGKGNGMVDSHLTSVFTASNEMPQDDGGVSLAPLQDRILFWKMVSYPSGSVRDKLIERACQVNMYPRSEEAKTKQAKKRPTITLDELRELQEAVYQVEIPASIRDSLRELREDLENNAGIILSPRREEKFPKILKAVALLDGRLVVEDTDLAILRHCCWENEKQITKVFEIVHKVGNGISQEIQSHYATGQALMDDLNSKYQTAQPLERSMMIINTQTSIQKLSEGANNIFDQLSKTGKSTTKVEELLDQLDAWMLETQQKMAIPAIKRRGKVEVETTDEDENE